MAAFLLLWTTLAFLFSSPLLPTLGLGNLGGPTHQRHDVVASHGVVATDDGRCSRIGMDALREGGHAVDAAVAASLCLGVVGLASSGMGGGSFMLILLASGEAQAFDMRETAPMKASEVLRFASIIMFFMVLNFTEIIHLKSYMHLVLHMRHAIALHRADLFRCHNSTGGTVFYSDNTREMHGYIDLSRETLSSESIHQYSLSTHIDSLFSGYVCWQCY